jgi:hypothetical protein
MSSIRMKLETLRVLWRPCALRACRYGEMLGLGAHLLTLLKEEHQNICVKASMKGVMMPCSELPKEAMWQTPLA